MEGRLSFSHGGTVMKKRLPILLLLLSLCLSAGASGEIITLPVDFSGGVAYTDTFMEDKFHYEDPSITVDRESYFDEAHKCDVSLARVKIANASQIRTIVAEEYVGVKKMDCNALARRVNAVLAINGDFYIYDAGRYVYRQGRVMREGMRSGQDLMLIDEDGDFHILLADEKPEEMDKTVINGKKVINALCFGPALIKDGVKCVDYSRAPKYSRPDERLRRMAIAQTGPLEYLVITVSNYGMTEDELADYLLSLGPVTQAYNLDGGDSSSIVFLGRRVNETSAHERIISDMVYWASAYVPDEQP